MPTRKDKKSSKSRPSKPRIKSSKSKKSKNPKFKNKNKNPTFEKKSLPRIDTSLAMTNSASPASLGMFGSASKLDSPIYNSNTGNFDEGLDLFAQEDNNVPLKGYEIGNDSSINNRAIPNFSPGSVLSSMAEDVAEPAHTKNHLNLKISTIDTKYREEFKSALREDRNSIREEIAHRKKQPGNVDYADMFTPTSPSQSPMTPSTRNIKHSFNYHNDGDSPTPQDILLHRNEKEYNRFMSKTSDPAKVKAGEKFYGRAKQIKDTLIQIDKEDYVAPVRPPEPTQNTQRSNHHNSAYGPQEKQQSILSSMTSEKNKDNIYNIGLMMSDISKEHEQKNEAEYDTSFHLNDN